LIAASFEQIEDWIDAPADAIARAQATWPGPYTWIFPRSRRVPEWVAGGHSGIALRVTAHEIAAALCCAFGGPIVSTSANVHGQPPARGAVELRGEGEKSLGRSLRYCTGACGAIRGATAARSFARTSDRLAVGSSDPHAGIPRRSHSTGRAFAVRIRGDQSLRRPLRFSGCLRRTGRARPDKSAAALARTTRHRRSADRTRGQLHDRRCAARSGAAALSALRAVARGF